MIFVFNSATLFAQSHGRWAELSRQERVEMLSNSGMLVAIESSPTFAQPPPITVEESAALLPDSRLKYLCSARGPHYPPSSSIPQNRTDPGRVRSTLASSDAKEASTVGCGKGVVETTVRRASPRRQSYIPLDEDGTSRLRTRLREARTIDRFYHERGYMSHLVSQ